MNMKRNKKVYVLNMDTSKKEKEEFVIGKLSEISVFRKLQQVIQVNCIKDF